MDDRRRWRSVRRRRKDIEKDPHRRQARAKTDLAFHLATDFASQGACDVDIAFVAERRMPEVAAFQEYDHIEA